MKNKFGYKKSMMNKRLQYPKKIMKFQIYNKKSRI